MATLHKTFEQALAGLLQRTRSDSRRPKTSKVDAGLDWISLIKNGLPVATVDLLSTSLKLPKQDIITVLRIPNRTFSRRSRLEATESDRFYRLARILTQTEETLGSIERAREWLKTKNRALGNQIPFDLLDTDFGARQVEEILVRINHGMIS